MTASPVPPAKLLSRAAAQLEALSNPDRLALLGAVARLGDGCALTELAADRGLDLRTLTRHTAVLEGAGLLTLHTHQVRLELDELAAVAAALVAALPVSALLADEPDLGRLFRHGRLVELPLLNRVDERERLAALLVRLLPADRTLTEAEVNSTLAEVVDDVASVRRFLVDAGVLTREAGRDYRRV